MGTATFTVRECLDALLAEAVRADAAAQLVQARGWAELARGAELSEGLEHLASLGIHEVTLEAWLQPPGWFAKLRFRVRRLLGGRPEPPPFRFAPHSSEDASLHLLLRVRRTPEGGWASTVSPGDQTQSGEPIRIPRVAL